MTYSFPFCLVCYIDLCVCKRSAELQAQDLGRDEVSPQGASEFKVQEPQEGVRAQACPWCSVALHGVEV